MTDLKSIVERLEAPTTPGHLDLSEVQGQTQFTSFNLDLLESEGKSGSKQDECYRALNAQIDDLEGLIEKVTSQNLTLRSEVSELRLKLKGMEAKYQSRQERVTAL